MGIQEDNIRAAGRVARKEGKHDVTLVAESGDLEVFRAGSSFQAGQEIRDAAQRYIRKTL